jgi:hypothetical protein
MIYESLACLTEELNELLKAKLNSKEDKAVLSGIVAPDGSMAVQGENKVLVTLVNLEREPAAAAKTIPNRSAAVNINLYILFSAYFGSGNYTESLRFLSFIVTFFQHKNVFTHTNTPRMDSGIGKLILEMESLTPDKMNNLWTTLGAKYMPSVLYKARMLTYDDAVIREFRPDIKSVERENQPVQ